MTRQQLMGSKNDDDNTKLVDGLGDQSSSDDAQGDGDASGDAGSDGGTGDEPPTSGPGDGSGHGDGGNDRTFTQQDVSRMMAREKQQGRNSVFNELGIDPNDTNTVNMIKAIMASQKQQEEPPVAPSAELIEAQHRADVAEAKAEAMMLGADPKFVDDIVTLATAKLTESDETDFKTVVEGIKSKYPVWFGVKSEDDDKPGHRGTGSTLPRHSDNGSSGSEMSLGQRLAAARAPKKPTKSYWGSNR